MLLTLFILLLAWQIGTEFQILTRDNIIIGETIPAGVGIQNSHGVHVSVERGRSLSPTQFSRPLGRGNIVMHNLVVSYIF